MPSLGPPPRGVWRPFSFSLGFGPGILAGKLKEVFEPFYTSKSSGMGMGLSIARTIVEAHSGTISAENRAGQGAVFRFRLPLAQTKA